MTKKATYSVGIYCRLSVDDGQAGESGSIETQRTLLTQYCKEQGFPIHDYYCDDGWSGTSFERPRFQQMIADIEAGLVNLVVVKDLSRFGREYAQMGLYIEHYFEEHEVRFIAVGEGIDTLNGTDNILMPIANVNELIEKIVVHEKENDWNGNKVQRVDIHYRFVGYMPVPNILEAFGRVEAVSLQELWEAAEQKLLAGQIEPASA